MRPAFQWRETKLGAVAGVDRQIVSAENIESGSSYVGLEHIDGEGTITRGSVNAGDLRSSKHAFSERHVLYGKLRPYLRKIARPTFSGVCSTDILPILPGPDVDRDYLFYLLRQPRMISLATARSEGVNLPRLSPKTLLEFPVSLPPLVEQRRIAAMLDKADAVRRKQRERLRLLDEFLRSAFLEMFGDPVRNEKGWEVVRLGDCLATRPVIGTITPATEGGELRLIRVGQLGQHDVATDRCGRVSLDKNEVLRFEAREGDLLLARAIGSEQHLGKASVVQATSDLVVFDSHVMRLRFDTSRVRALFLWQWLQTSGGRRLFLKRGGRTAVQFNINAAQVLDVRVPLPPSENQDRFLAIAATARAARATIAGSGELARSLFDSLTHRASNEQPS